MSSILDKIKNVFTTTSAKQAPVTTNTIGYSSPTISTGGVTLGTITTTGTGGIINLSSTGTTYTTNGWFTYNDSEQIRKLKRKLYRIQKSGKWVHEMDEEMFDSVCRLLKSEIRADNEMAREIVFNSKMSTKQRSVLADMFSDKLWYEGYTRSTIGGQERMRINSYGNVGIGNPYYTGSLSISSGTYSGTYSGVNINNTTSNKKLTAKKAAK